MAAAYRSDRLTVGVGNGLNQLNGITKNRKNKTAKKSRSSLAIVYTTHSKNTMQGLKTDPQNQRDNRGSFSHAIIIF